MFTFFSIAVAHSLVNSYGQRHHFINRHHYYYYELSKTRDKLTLKIQVVAFLIDEVIRSWLLKVSFKAEIRLRQPKMLGLKSHHKNY